MHLNSLVDTQASKGVVVVIVIWVIFPFYMKEESPANQKRIVATITKNTGL